MKLTQELKQHMEQATSDTAWLEKLRTAATWEEYVELLREKGIEIPPEMKEAFEAAKSRRTGELQDDELARVAGGVGPVFPCNKQFDSFLCNWTCCPHKKKEMMFGGHYCDLGYWRDGPTMKDIDLLGPSMKKIEEYDPFDPKRYTIE